MEFVQPIRERKQIEAMKKVLRGSNMRDYCMFVVGINSALRIGDLLRLRICDVVDPNGDVRERITILESKTGKRKDFPMGKTTKKAIVEYLSIRKLNDANEPLFLSAKGGAIKRNQAWRVLSEAASAVGITHRIGTHTMRKTFGYFAYREGKDLSLVQKLLNHSSPATTLRYIGITQDELDDVYLSLDL